MEEAADIPICDMGDISQKDVHINTSSCIMNKNFIIESCGPEIQCAELPPLLVAGITLC